MSGRTRIAALYSHGTHFPRLLRFLREEFPGCELCAVVPPGYPGHLLEGACDTVIRTERERYGLRDGRAVLALVRTLRAERYDAVVVMFPSLKLRMLAKAAGAGAAYVYTADRRFYPVKLNPPAEAAGMLLRHLRGRLTYLRIAFIVRFRRVGK